MLQAGGKSSASVKDSLLGANYPFKELLQVISTEPPGENQQMRRKSLPFASWCRRTQPFPRSERKECAWAQ